MLTLSNRKQATRATKAHVVESIIVGGKNKKGIKESSFASFTIRWTLPRL